jgi:hypothetical protein
VQYIDAYTKPDASLIPPHEISQEASQLGGFNWRKEERPVKEEVLYQQEQAPQGPLKLKPKNLQTTPAESTKLQRKPSGRKP